MERARGHSDRGITRSPWLASRLGVLALPSGEGAPRTAAWLVVGSHQGVATVSNSQPASQQPTFCCPCGRSSWSEPCHGEVNWRARLADGVGGGCGRGAAMMYAAHIECPKGRRAANGALVQGNRVDPSRSKSEAANVRRAGRCVSNGAPVAGRVIAAGLPCSAWLCLAVHPSRDPLSGALVRRPLRHEPAHRLRVEIVYRSKSPHPAHPPHPLLTLLACHRLAILNPPIRVHRCPRRPSHHITFHRDTANLSLLRRLAFSTPVSAQSHQTHHGRGLFE